MTENDKIVVEIIHLNQYSFAREDELTKPVPPPFCDAKTKEIGISFDKYWLNRLSRPEKKDKSGEYIMVCTQCFYSADKYIKNKLWIDGKTFKEWKKEGKMIKAIEK